MKRKIGRLVVIGSLAASAAFAQNNNNNNMRNGNSMGQGSMQATSTASDDLAWAPALGGIAVLGVIVGVTAAAAASTPSTFSH